MKRKLLNWKGLFLLTLVIAAVVGIATWLVTYQIWAGLVSSFGLWVIPNVIFNYKTLKEWGEGIYQTTKIGWKQMKLNQIEREENMQCLLRLEALQRNNLYSCFQTYVRSVRYRDLQSNIPKIVVAVEFLNFTIFQWKIISWELDSERSSRDYAINCQQQPYKFRQQGRKAEITLDRCQPANCDIELEIDNSVLECIRLAASNKALVSYRIPIIWQLEAKNKGIENYNYKDNLPYDAVPNLGM